MDLAVVIPTRGRPDHLRHTLRALAGQETDFAWEVLVVGDPDSQTEERSVVAAVRELHPRLPCRYLVPEHRGRGEPPAAGRSRNAGLRATTAPRVLFLDDDCLAQHGLLAAHHRFAAHALMAVIGFRRMLAPAATAALDQLAPAALGELDGGPESRCRPDSPLPRIFAFAKRQDPAIHNYVYTCHLSVAREKALELGGFDDRFLGSGFEDVEFGLRWAVGGGRFYALGSPCVVHQHHPPSPDQYGHIEHNRRLLHEARKRYLPRPAPEHAAP